MTVKFDATDAELSAVRKIARRAAHLARTHGDRRKFGAIRLNVVMDLLATHANGCPLDFERMAAADDFNLTHDVISIGRHLDRDTGKLGNGFLPRFFKKGCAA